jgi:dihydrofolate synthase/folylpolyglutamate synthase
MLASILRAGGHHVGTMPSPHLSSYTERIQVDGVPISESEFAAAVAWLRPRLEGISADLGPPTEFEILTGLAITYLANRCDRLVIEVGMGGRLDSTNVLDLGVAVITNIGLDHTKHLGDTVEKIAFEKAGIIKPGSRVLTGAQEPALGVIEERADELGAPLWRLGREIRYGARDQGWQGLLLEVEGPGFRHENLRVPLPGRFQAANAALAVAAAEAAGDASPEAVARGVAETVWAGRLELVSSRPQLVLDGAHNPPGLAALADSLPSLRSDGLTVVFGIMADKDIQASLAEVRRLRPDRLILTAAASGRAADPDDLLEAWGGAAEISRPVAEAVAAALAGAEPERTILVCGSLYLVGEVKDWLEARR